MGKPLMGEKQISGLDAGATCALRINSSMAALSVSLRARA